MAVSIRRRGAGCVTVALLAILPLIASAAPATELASAASIARCRTLVRNFLALAPIIRRTNDRIAHLLDAKQYGQAASALRSAAGHYGDDAWAGDALGNLYAAGLGVRRSAGSAFRWYLWSAERGDRVAERQVANAYLNGEGTQRNAAAAAHWSSLSVAPWQLAVMNYDLSRTYARGHLAPVNPGKSSYYLDRSLAQLRALTRDRNGEASYYLGRAYEYGRGVPRDRTKAIGYLCRAAELHYAPAIYVIRRLQK